MKQGIELNVTLPLFLFSIFYYKSKQDWKYFPKQFLKIIEKRSVCWVFETNVPYISVDNYDNRTISSLEIIWGKIFERNVVWWYWLKPFLLPYTHFNYVHCYTIHIDESAKYLVKIKREYFIEHGVTRPQNCVIWIS